jgi:hypothetical protein
LLLSSKIKDSETPVRSSKLYSNLEGLALSQFEENWERARTVGSD